MFRELFNVPVVVNQGMQPVQDLSPGGPPTLATGGEPTEVQREGAFITVQSLVSFPGATAAVTVLANVAGWAMPSWRGRPLVFVVASALVGITIYLINETDPLKTAASGSRRLIRMIIALFNTLVILSAAVGADAMLHPAGAAGAPIQTSVEASHG